MRVAKLPQRTVISKITAIQKMMISSSPETNVFLVTDPAADTCGQAPSKALRSSQRYGRSCVLPASRRTRCLSSSSPCFLLVNTLLWLSSLAFSHQVPNLYFFFFFPFLLMSNADAKGEAQQQPAKQVSPARPLQRGLPICSALNDPFFLS